MQYVNAVCDVHQSSAIRRLPYIHASPIAHLSRNRDGDKESGRASARNVTDKSGVARQMHYIAASAPSDVSGAAQGRWYAFVHVHSQRERTMLMTIVVVLVVLWLLGMVTATTMGGLVHVLLVLAIIVVLVRVIQGRRVI